MQSFTELTLSPALLRAITDLGYETPSPIQAQALPILLGEPVDFLGLAGTGTGKTATFAIPLLERIEPKDKTVQALILCPTRELAVQVTGQIALLGKYKGARVVTLYGGASYNDQIHGLRQGATIVVGTPGRVIDHIDRGTLKLENLKVLVLDEADEMLSMGFKEDLEKVLEQAPRESSNVWLFSATMSREVRRVADTYLRTPKSVHVNRTEMLSAGVEQYYYPTMESNKPEILCKLIEAADDFYGLIFCQTKSLVADLTMYLNDRGYKVDCLHGDKDQTSRERTMQAFRDRKVRILVCTDVASRGLDVKDITHVINYSLPRELDSYVHRIGRTARSGKTGIAMNLVTASHRRLIFQIEQMTKTRMLEGRIPTRREIGAKKVASLLTPFQTQPLHTRALEILSEEWKTQLATMTPEEVAAHFITMMMPDIFNDGGGADKRGHSEQRRAPTSTATISAPRPGGPSVSAAVRPSRPAVLAPPAHHQPREREESMEEVAPVVAAAPRPVIRAADTDEAAPQVRPAQARPRIQPQTSASAPARREFARSEQPPLRSGPRPTPRPFAKTSERVERPPARRGDRSDMPKPMGKFAPKAPTPKPFAAKTSSEKAEALKTGTRRPAKSPGKEWNPKSDYIPLINRRARRAEKFGKPQAAPESDAKES
jgi:ATP-dependent RNA helicase DeaD